ncbi:FK506-binding protein 5 [Hondaea fermentalgiana]|uniref:FK506-binding protein 5 n=1 Tax=Hondaea fermentalgiana TaxID=2315210 RepID=A0A2R5GC69_9STRA|nr:FK506-binding protein 5 [Hondaea fermentalgiana]|eukprot:GBG28570.1 FK506-binding protein 5 [Hondaea fermentalgiana]
MPTKLVEASRRVLMQKQLLLSTMERLGCYEAYATKCPVVGSTIGGHVRHALDHYDRALDGILSKAKTSSSLSLVDYDTRLRGGDVEKDLSSAVEAILNCSERLGSITEEMLARPMQVQFNLSGNDDSKFLFESYAARELWFAAHHSIHHQAMIKLIIQCHDEKKTLAQALPRDFGMAPSTVLHNNTSNNAASASASGAASSSG